MIRIERDFVHLWRIVPSRFQPRGAVFDAGALLELAESIRDHGLINEVLVLDGGENERGEAIWELIAGERRTRASVALALARRTSTKTLEGWCAVLAQDGLMGLGDVYRETLKASKATIAAKQYFTNDMEAIHNLAVVENMGREQLTPLEEARAFQGLMEERGYSQRELARRVNKSQGYIAQRLGLLDLGESAQEAVSTRVLSLTHARALARVPLEMQGAATAWAVEAVSAQGDTPATTRQVEGRLRAIAAFVDPARWEPDGETVYRPEERNRLAWIRAAVEAADLDARSDAIMGLTDVEPYFGMENLITKRARTIVSDQEYTRMVLEALGARAATWEGFARMTGRTCDRCVMREDRTRNDDGLVTHYCRPDNAVTQTCERFIGEDDPWVIQLWDYHLRNHFDGQAREGQGFVYVDDPQVYAEGYAQTVVHLREARARRKAEDQAAHLEPLRRFVEWNLRQPEEVKADFQFHGCEKCARYEPLRSEEGKVPCRYTENPLEGRWETTRAPEFGLLVRRDGVMMARCEGFVYRATPNIRAVAGWEFLDAAAVASWVMAMRRSSYYVNDHGVMWGVLAWLDRGRAVGKPINWKGIAQIVKNGLRPGNNINDGHVATLLTVIAQEVEFIGHYGGDKPFGFLDPTTLVTTDYMPWRKRYGRDVARERWPEGWTFPDVDLEL